MTIPVDVMLWVGGGICTIIGALVIILYNSIANRLDTVIAYVMGPEAKVIPAAKCAQATADIREEIHIEREERKSDVLGLQKQINDHVQAS